METKGWITIAVFAVLIIIGLFVLLPILGIEMPDFGGSYSASGSSHYEGETTTGGGVGFGWSSVVIVLVILAVGYLGFRNLKDSPFRLWFTPEGRAILKEKRRKRYIKTREDILAFRNLVAKGEGVLTKKLDEYKTDGKWTLINLFKAKPSTILTEKNNRTGRKEDYKIKVVRHSKGIDDGDLLDIIFSTYPSDLKKDWKFGVYTDNISDDQMELVFLHSVIRWCYDRIHQGEMPEMANTMGILNLFKKFMGNNGKDAEEFYLSNDAEFLKFEDTIKELLETYNKDGTDQIFSSCNLNVSDFDINDHATAKVSELIRQYPSKGPFKAIHMYTIHGGKTNNTTNMRKMLEFNVSTYRDFIGVKSNFEEIVNYLRSENIDDLFEEVLMSSKNKPKLALKSLKKGFAETVLGKKKAITAELNNVEELIKKIRFLSGESYSWWVQREFKEFSIDIKEVLKHYSLEEWTKSYETLCNNPSCSERGKPVEITVPKTDIKCSECGESLALPKGWYPENFHKRMALMYSSIFFPWLYTLATYKLFYVLVSKYIDSLERVKKLIIEEGDLGVQEE